MKVIMRLIWLIPATASVAFFLFSDWAVAAEGPLGFMVEHTRNTRGAQISLDVAPFFKWRQIESSERPPTRSRCESPLAHP